MNLKWEEEGGDYFAYHGEIMVEAFRVLCGGWRCWVNDGDVRVAYVGKPLRSAKRAKAMAEEQLRWYLKGKDNA